MSKNKFGLAILLGLSVTSKIAFAEITTLPQCESASNAVMPQPDAIRWIDDNVSVYTIGGNTNGLGYQESGFEKAVLDKEMRLTLLNGPEDFAFTGADGPGTAAASVGVFKNGALTYDSSFITTNRAEFRTTKADTFISGNDGTGVFIFPEQGPKAGDVYTVSIKFTKPVTAFSFDLVDIFDTLKDNNPTLRYEIHADESVVAYIDGNLLGDDKTGQLNLFDGEHNFKGTMLSGHNIENTIGIIPAKPVSQVIIKHSVLSSSVMASARDPHGIDRFAYSTDKSRCL
jgi:hypothetical protein